MVDANREKRRVGCAYAGSHDVSKNALGIPSNRQERGKEI
jgi:hypothetical protein